VRCCINERAWCPSFELTKRGEHHERATINPVLLSTRPAIQFVVSGPHDQSSEALFGRATVRRWESGYPAASMPPFAAPTVRRSSFRPGKFFEDLVATSVRDWFRNTT